MKFFINKTLVNNIFLLKKNVKWFSPLYELRNKVFFVRLPSIEQNLSYWPQIQTQEFIKFSEHSFYKKPPGQFLTSSTMYCSYTINPFLANVPILYPPPPPSLKTPENQRFSGAFKGYKMGTLARNGLTKPTDFASDTSDSFNLKQILFIQEGYNESLVGILGMQ